MPPPLLMLLLLLLLLFTLLFLLLPTLPTLPPSTLQTPPNGKSSSKLSSEPAAPPAPRSDGFSLPFSCYFPAKLQSADRLLLLHHAYILRDVCYSSPCACCPLQAPTASPCTHISKQNKIDSKTAQVLRVKLNPLNPEAKSLITSKLQAVTRGRSRSNHLVLAAHVRAIVIKRRWRGRR